MEWIKIILLSLVAAILYGILHDQVTARVCVEYFTIGHPSIIGSKDPTTVALVWGVMATWWVGLTLGILLAAVSRVGSRPTLTVRDLGRPLVALLGMMAVVAILAGVLGFCLARSRIVQLLPALSERIALDRQARFIADLWAHTASYLSGFVGGLALVGWALLLRRRLGRAKYRVGDRVRVTLPTQTLRNQITSRDSRSWPNCGRCEDCEKSVRLGGSVDTFWTPK